MHAHKTLTPMSGLKSKPSLLQDYVSRAQIANLYKVTPETIVRWQNRDGMPVHRIGVQPVYFLAEVAAWFITRPNRMHGGLRNANA